MCAVIALSLALGNCSGVWVAKSRDGVWEEIIDPDTVWFGQSVECRQKEKEPILELNKA